MCMRRIRCEEKKKEERKRKREKYGFSGEAVPIVAHCVKKFCARIERERKGKREREKRKWERVKTERYKSLLSVLLSICVSPSFFLSSLFVGHAEHPLDFSYFILI